jgi:hypothetical protein
MAGLGYRIFSAGEVLTASNVQGYLQDQAVMVFAGTAARGSALTSGTVSLATEGMVTFIKDVDQIQTFNGSTWSPQPYAQAAGTADAATSALAADAIETITITFPSGRFSVAPILSVSSQSSRYQMGILSIGTASANLQVRNVSAATGTSATIYYQAVQMTSGTAAG